MIKLSLFLVLTMLLSGSAWAGGSKKQPTGSAPKIPQKFQAFPNRGNGSQQSNSMLNQKPFKAQGITLQHLKPNRPLNLLKGTESTGNHLTTNGAKPFATNLNPKPFQSQGITLQNLAPKPLQAQGITAQNLVPNRPNMLKGNEGVHNTLPVMTNSMPTKPGFVWTGTHWERAKATPVVSPVPLGNPPTVTYENFTTMANNPPPAIRVPVQDPSKPGRPLGGRPQHGPGTNGGLTVNWVAGSQRPANVTGVGASPIDHFFSTVGSNIGSDFKPGKLTRPTVVDHR